MTDKIRSALESTRDFLLELAGGAVNPMVAQIKLAHKIDDALEELDKHQPQPPNYIARLLHREVTITPIKGDKITGVVDGFNAWEIRIKTKETLGKYGSDILVFKHAILRIDGDLSRSGKNAEAKVTHVNPNCKDSTRCKPHGETGPVEYVGTGDK